MAATSFGTRLAQAITRFGGLTVGIDPHAHLLDAWGLPGGVAGLERFSLAMVEQAADRVGIVKPQVAFFERYGAAGLAVLERVITDARQAGLLVIADAKRGDIGSTNQGYADAWLAADAPLASDALTVSPYLGVHALDPLYETALANGAGLFVLAATSNPQAEPVQAATVEGASLAAHVAQEVSVWNSAAPGSFGIVFGATQAPVSRGLDVRTTGNTFPVLAPGFGAQGARLEDAAMLFPGCASRLLASVSRSVAGTSAVEAGRLIDEHVVRLRTAWQQS